VLLGQHRLESAALNREFGRFGLDLTNEQGHSYCDQ